MSDVTFHPAASPADGIPWLDRTVAWFKRRELAGLLVGVGFQFVALVGLIIWRLVPLVTGETILLRVVPVDPRDMFRGDYVILSYGVGDGWSGNGAKLTPGHTVYSTLVREGDGRHWRLGTLSLDRPQSGMFLRGKLGPRGRPEFGIESYYVQEGKGRQYEEAIRYRRLWAEVAVTRDGQAALRGLRIE